jgi:outer membrane biogenesis lipoprotein LolB
MTSHRLALLVFPVAALVLTGCEAKSANPTSHRSRARLLRQHFGAGTGGARAA